MLQYPSMSFHILKSLHDNSLSIIIVRTQNFLNGQGLGLGSQFICIVGLVFPTKGSSLPSVSVTPLSPHEFLFFPF